MLYLRFLYETLIYIEQDFASSFTTICIYLWKANSSFKAYNFICYTIYHDTFFVDNLIDAETKIVYKECGVIRPSMVTKVMEQKSYIIRPTVKN